MKHNLTHRILSIVLCLALLMAYLPAASQAASIADIQDRVADPSTMDSWKDYFLSDPMTTENAGGVWTDKSVFADNSAFPGISKESDSFLVALSAIGSTMSVSGLSNMPTDTMMILDLSSSMYPGRNPGTVQTMLTSVNDSIVKLQALNPHNRVGVVVYFGGPDRNQSDASNSKVMLPLGRYSGTTTFLKANVSGNKLQSVQVNAGVKNAEGQTMAQTKHTVNDVAGTYAQLGLLDAMDQFLAADTKIPATADYQPDVTRVPIFLFMSDGEPTAATHDYTKKVNAGMGNNTVSIRYPNETDFVTQLTAAYAREMVDDHYKATTPLFYSLSLGSSVSLAVMDPKENTPATIQTYWSNLLTDGKTNITVYNSPDGWSNPTVKKTYTVKTTTAAGKTFPSTVNQRNYVDRAYTAADASKLTDIFESIVNQIDLVSQYTPTLVDGNDDLSGYISFVDKVGHYMQVTDIKGIQIGSVMFTGAELSKNFVPGGGDLGTNDDRKPLGDQMVWAVMARLGITDAEVARQLIGKAYQYGQLSYTDQDNFSNYIGWYADAAGNYLDFWHEGVTTAPAAAVYTVRSYGYLGEVDEEHGVVPSDMMYATVQVRHEIATGDESVVFAVPAALIPLVTYKVKLDKEGDVEEFKVTGANAPIRLIYEVALDDHITPYTLTDVVDEDYLAANTNADGSVNFYTNQYEVDNSTGYGKVNTYSYFNPSRQNDRYYYTQDTPICSDTNGTVYNGDTHPFLLAESNDFYRAVKVYEVGRIHTHYLPVSAAALETAERRNGDWIIHKGNVYVELSDYIIDKSANPTGTLTYANQPFVDTNGHTVDDTGYNFIVGATLGNNGRLTVMPETGIVISKELAPDATPTTETFTFEIHDEGYQLYDRSFEGRLVKADGTTEQITVTFDRYHATVHVAPGEKLYIGGLPVGIRLYVLEKTTLEYTAEDDRFFVTTAAGQMQEAAFVNRDRGEGSVTVTKQVVHPLGDGYQLPTDQRFTMVVSLMGFDLSNRTFPAAGVLDSVTTDENGQFTVRLAHNESLTINGLPEGSIVDVKELHPGEGWTVGYIDVNREGDGRVLVNKDTDLDITVVNTYTPKETPVSITVNGHKSFTTDGLDWNGAEFEFQLQRWVNGGWTTIATDTANEADPTFNFSAAMSAEVFTEVGVYSYQIVETNGGQTVGGITYDATVYAFAVTVTDADMDGALEVADVESFHNSAAFAVDPDGSWRIDIAFNNAYNAEGTQLPLDIQKNLVNPSGSPLVDLSGYAFGLYEGETLIATSTYTNDLGQAQLIVNYELADEGLHTYTLRELIPAEPIPGMDYSREVYTIQVEVIDNGDGTISAVNVTPDYATPVFTNTYTTQNTELPIDFVNKDLTGRDLVPGEFAFELRLEGQTVLTGTNDGEGNVIFTDKLYFTTVGTWTYELVEASADGNGVITDKTVYILTVTVTDVAGQLEAAYVLSNGEREVTFFNSYTTQPTEVTFTGTKYLEGRDLLAGEFTFELVQGDVVIKTATNDADGTVTFEPIPLTAVGTYTYLIREQLGEAEGVTYDPTEYRITVTVTDDGEGDLTQTTEIAGGDAIVFNNTYEEEDVPPPPSDPTDPSEPTEPSEPSEPSTPTEPDDGPPQTGDTGISLWLAMLAVSCGGVLTLLSLKKEEKTE